MGSTPSWTSQKDLALGSLGTIGCPQTACQMFSGIQLKKCWQVCINDESVYVGEDSR